MVLGMAPCLFVSVSIDYNCTTSESIKRVLGDPWCTMAYNIPGQGNIGSCPGLKNFNHEITTKTNPYFTNTISKKPVRKNDFACFALLFIVAAFIL